MKNKKSDCCNASVSVEGVIAKYYICKKCEKACNEGANVEYDIYAEIIEKNLFCEIEASLEDNEVLSTCWEAIKDNLYEMRTYYEE